MAQWGIIGGNLFSAKFWGFFKNEDARSLFVCFVLWFARTGKIWEYVNRGILREDAVHPRFSNSRALSVFSIDGCKILYQPLGFSNDGHKLPSKYCCQQKLVGVIGPFSKSLGVIAAINLSKRQQPWNLCICTYPHFKRKHFWRIANHLAINRLPPIT